MAKAAEVLCVALLGAYCLPFYLWEEVVAKGTPFGTSFGMLALRAAVELWFWDQVHLELL